MFHTWAYFGLGPISSEEFSSLMFEIKHRPGLAALPELLPPPTVFLGAVNKSFFFLNLLLWPGVSRSWVCSFFLFSLWASALGGHNQPLFSRALSSWETPRVGRASLPACRMLNVHQPLAAISTLSSHLNILPCVQNNYFIKLEAAEGRKLFSGVVRTKISICFLCWENVEDFAVFQVMQKPKQTILSLL